MTFSSFLSSNILTLWAIILLTLSAMLSPKGILINESMRPPYLLLFKKGFSNYFQGIKAHQYMQ